MKVFPPPRVVQIYNPGLRALHWLMAALIFVALALGVWATQLPRGGLRSEVLFFHKSIGVTLLCLVVPMETVSVQLNAIVLQLGTSTALGLGGAALFLTMLIDRRFFRI